MEASPDIVLITNRSLLCQSLFLLDVCFLFLAQVRHFAVAIGCGQNFLAPEKYLTRLQGLKENRRNC
jgi:hypothetical protein